LAVPYSYPTSTTFGLKVQVKAIDAYAHTLLAVLAVVFLRRLLDLRPSC
jgi:hypothetical protein